MREITATVTVEKAKPTDEAFAGSIKRAFQKSMQEIDKAIAEGRLVYPKPGERYVVRL